jgi:RNA polymerase sigma-70 factor (ECF subfamily)
MRAIPFTTVFSPPAEAALKLDADSFGRFYDAAVSRVYGYFLHRCGGSEAVAEDLTQETFLAAVAELRKDRRVDTPMAWIFGIARHKLLDHYRRQERVDRPLAVTLDADPSEDDQPEEGEHARAVSALASVAATQRAALVLCYVDGYSVPEAARLLDKSADAVESLLARGRQSFRRAYMEDQP